MERPPSSRGGWASNLAYCCALLGMATTPIVLRAGSPFDPADIFFLAAIALMLADVAGLQLAVRRSIGVLLAGGLMTLGALVTAIATSDPNDALTPFKYLINTVLLFLLFCTASRSWQRWCGLAGAFVLGLAVNASVALWQVSDRSRWTDCMTQGRACGLTEHPNELGYALCAGIFVCIALLSVLQGRRRLLVWAALPLLVGGLAASGSLGSTMAVVAGLAAIAVGSLWLNPGRFAKSAAVLGMVGLVVFVPVAPRLSESVVVRRLSAYIAAPSVEGTTLGERALINEQALAMISERPLTGVGTFRGRLPHTVHNIVIGAWFDTGLLGMMGVVALLLVVYWKSIRALQVSQTSPSGAFAALAIIGMMVALLVAAQVAPIGYRRNAWAPYWLAVSLGVLWIRIGPSWRAGTPRLRASGGHSKPPYRPARGVRA